MGKPRWLWLLCVLAISAPSAQAEDKIPVVNESAVGGIWKLPATSKRAVMEFPPEYQNQQEQVCLAVGYLINDDGSTSDLALLKSWSSREPRRDRDRYWGAFARVASAELSKWRFVPKAEAGVARAVYTVATFVFAPTGVPEPSTRCAIPNLSLRIIELMQDTRVRRRMTSTGIFNRLDLNRMVEARYQNYRGFGMSQRDGPPEPPPTPPRPHLIKDG